MTPNPLAVLGPPSPAQNCRYDGGCGGHGEAGSGLPPEVHARVADHPCYGPGADHRFARIHLPVAPACNIQCHYCNRKYDCAGESRPGVTSRRLTPEEAVARARAVAAELPKLSVVGIAGPGDPLAPGSVAHTFATLEGVKRALPGVRLCVSTNGLALADHADRLADLGVEHVTVTVNALDPEVGARLYAWVAWRGRRYTGPGAARLLSERQLEGLARLATRGVLCKVNSVLVPGVNDAHLPAVSRAVQGLGCFAHNVMPLLSAPEHGTHFGLTGQRGPTEAELAAVRRACGGRQMTHCRQCRADAVGMLGDDQNARFAHAGEAVRVAVATRDGARVDQHFGHATAFRVYELAAGGARLVAEREVSHYCRGGEGDEDVLPATLRALADCRAVLVAKVGRCPREALQAAGIEPSEAQAFLPIPAALAAWEAARAKEVA
ncbi:nitrogenase cofactor biosynthesis protein NifB [Anaeromyxobacter paludicola]|uniref:FeMo cofactor biosynthesis protein NifB n=1 Tax=Anaeromyxobacter paludicola TaxID=2918171 RepID=A0ABM7XG89_9BACT|nr:nitrogenase cofactor biosynthesis protein NifB [Anaeromyxobacter paludicola]BDG10847.1 nitrogenase cofactor biosynthesis protein NifB [Anaeromyxobacter paludicola]